MFIRAFRSNERSLNIAKNKFLMAAVLAFGIVPTASVFVAPPVKASAAPIVKTVNGTQYPYANTAYPSNSADPWGMYKRECVSYTAWAVSASGRTMPYWGGKGNAKQWPSNAQAAGIPVDGSPRAGDVAIRMSGSYGHAMYVERVNANGTIFVSQYNTDYKGNYSTATISASGLKFIHF